MVSLFKTTEATRRININIGSNNCWQCLNSFLLYQLCIWNCEGVYYAFSHGKWTHLKSWIFYSFNGRIRSRIQRGTRNFCCTCWRQVGTISLLCCCLFLFCLFVCFFGCFFYFTLSFRKEIEIGQKRSSRWQELFTISLLILEIAKITKNPIMLSP